MLQVELALNPLFLASPAVARCAPLELCTGGCFICVCFTFLANFLGNVLQLLWI